MIDNIKIATLNLCLGLKNKKEEVKRLIQTNKIDILCVQETEIPKDFPVDMLTFRGYQYENENINCKSRCGIYITNNLSYVRRSDLEIQGIHAIIIDLKNTKNTRIINIYRTFNPVNNQTQRAYFDSLLTLISQCTNKNTILIGDFNLDYNKRSDIFYSHKHYFAALEATLNPFNLIQIINFDTWSRLINNVYCSSLLDHVYVSDPLETTNITQIIPPFGDHLLITFELGSNKTANKTFYKRNWKAYNKDILLNHLNNTCWSIDLDDVQSYWNLFESKLVEIVDIVAPLESKLSNNIIYETPQWIKKKINRRNLLKKRLKKPNINSQTTSHELKVLNKDIKNFFHQQKKKSVRKGILPGSSKSLWDAVKIAKDLNVSSLPDILYHNEVVIPVSLQADEFGKFFDAKVKNIVNSTITSPTVYNGKRKLNCNDEFFMTSADIIECLKSIKTKNCEGYDRIPQRILTDGAECLILPLTGLFERIYNQKAIPEQWSISKIIPIHKKGPKNNIENYRPIANLCSSSKIFEKLILKRLNKLEILNNIDLTGSQQHGFKKSRSTATLALQLQSLIARALDEDNYVLMSSIDLSAAFDVVNIDLLLTRLAVLGIPGDVVSLIEIWLKNRCYYVDINSITSCFFESNSGTIQGSILGPILYAIYVSPLFDLTDLSNFADDNFILTWNVDKETANIEMSNKLNLISKWLKDSGLKVNELKTEICLFYRKDTPPIEINIGNVIIKSMTSMNVLGVEFDSKLNWSKHISKVINKANKALHAIKMIKRFFNRDEILLLLTSNFYSILYYNSEIWHLPSLKPELKQLLLSASAKALKLCERTPDPMESFTNLHVKLKRALPNQIMQYKHAILLHKLYNERMPNADWVEMNFNQIITSRQTLFKISKTNRYKIGNNILTSRLTTINNKIDLNDLNLSLDSFKVKYKKVLLSP